MNSVKYLEKSCDLYKMLECIVYQTYPFLQTIQIKLVAIKRCIHKDQFAPLHTKFCCKNKLVLNFITIIKIVHFVILISTMTNTDTAMDVCLKLYA